MLPVTTTYSTAASMPPSVSSQEYACRPDTSLRPVSESMDCSALVLHSPANEKRKKPWSLLSLIPASVARLPWTLRMKWRRAGSKKEETVKRSPTSPFYTIKLPSNFHETRYGQQVLTIIKAIQESGVFKGTPKEMYAQLEHNVRVQTCDTGEAFNSLVRFFDPTQEPSEESTAFYTLIEKLRRRIAIAFDDLNLACASQQRMQKALLEESLKRITELTTRLFMDPNLPAPCIENIITFTTDEQRKLLGRKEEIQKKAIEEERQKALCMQANEALLKIEQEALGRRADHTTVEKDRCVYLSTEEEVKDFLSSLGGSQSTLYFRCIFIKPGEVADGVITGTIGRENTIFIPREGDATYQSKRECLEEIEKRLQTTRSTKHVIELTVWKEVSPLPHCLIPSSASLVPRIAEVLPSSPESLPALEASRPSQPPVHSPDSQATLLSVPKQPREG